MNVLFTASEMVPFYKVGERADAIGTLAQAIAERGHTVTVMLPGYPDIDRERYGFESADLVIPIPIGQELKPFAVSKTKWNGLTVFLLENDEYFRRGEGYEDIHGNYRINGLRFTCFSRAIIEAAKALRIKPDVVHAHDWQTALVLVYLSTLYSGDPLFRETAKLFTIHNIGYHGIFEESVFTMSGLPRDEFQISKMEYHGNVSFLKGGIVHADAISTVSETYAREITGKALGFGMQGVLYERKDDLYGIVNGIDQKEWNPATDRSIPARYTTKNLAGKKTCRTALLDECGMTDDETAPVFGMVTRLDEQKGIDLIEAAAGGLAALDLRLVILGMGNMKYHEAMGRITSSYPDKIQVIRRQDRHLAHLIFAGADAFLMPSRYEPCGLGQLIAMRYGTVPVVHATGGLADTVHDFSEGAECCTGIRFDSFTPAALIGAVSRAIALFREPGQEEWNTAVRHGMMHDFSWKTSARKYGELYEHIRQKAGKDRHKA
ncbi:glycogen synthase GlgA [bacterium]|nr:glycogen synthase GlgA [bacterium]